VSVARQAAEFGILRELRENANIGLREAALALGMSPSSLSLYERGRSRPSPGRALALRRFIKELLELPGAGEPPEAA
jgi:transcriptional regulator with XRE-family HTH domain